MSAKLAVLGLVIEEPGPPSRLTAKLRQRFSYAEFADSNVHSALNRLEREGLIREVKREAVDCSTPPALAEGPDHRHFEATPAGAEFFEAWLLASSGAPPLRDDLQMKIALCQPRDLERMIDLVHGQELVCSARIEHLRGCVGHTHPLTPDRWSGLMLVLVRDAERSFWGARLGWLCDVRGSLERIRDGLESATRRLA